MKYARQTQDALDRLDQSLAQLRGLIKRGDTKTALEFMEEGELKERFGELQNIITLSSTNQLGASGVSNLGSL
tara:strand:+ start:246 stop:464 length:219 start_codon:yes stop_codon:yes gene_type:complete